MLLKSENGGYEVDKDALLAAIAELSDEDRAEIVKALQIEPPKEDAIVDRVLKTLGLKKEETAPLIEDEQVREAIAKMETDIAEKDDRITELEKQVAGYEERDKEARRKDRVEKLAALGFTDEDAEGLEQVPDTILEKLVAANQVAATSDLFREIGKGTDDMPESPEAKLQRAAEEIRKEHPELSAVEAYRRALHDNEELYKQYLAEQDGQ